jgi:hypothetical protein
MLSTEEDALVPASDDHDLPPADPSVDDVAEDATQVNHSSDNVSAAPSDVGSPPTVAAAAVLTGMMSNGGSTDPMVPSSSPLPAAPPASSSLSLGGDSISDNSDQDDAAIATRKRIHQMDMSLAAAGSFDHIIRTLTPAATAVRAKQAAYHQAAKKKKKAKEDAKVTAAAAAAVAVAVAVAVATADPREEKQSQPKREGKTPIISIPAISSSTVVQPPAPAPVEKCISSDHRDHLILIAYLVSLSFYVSRRMVALY